MLSEYSINSIARVLLVLATLFLPMHIWAESSDDDTGTLIEITGVNDLLKQNIESHLAVEHGKIALSALGFPRSNEFIKRKTQSAMQALGYYKPQIELTGDHQKWFLAITPGSPVTWAAPEIKTSDSLRSDEQFSKLLTQHPFQLGKAINHGMYSDYKSKLQSLAIEKGFFDAGFIQSQLKIDEQALTAKVHWQFEEGQRYRFDNIEIIGSGLSPEFLARFLQVRPEQDYLQSDLLKTQQDLNRSGYFRLVDLEQSVDKVNKRVSLIIHLSDIDRYEFKTSLGYGTDSGSKFGVNWQDRQANQHGHKYSFGLELNKLENSIFSQYRIPLNDINDEWLNRVSYKEKDDLLARTTLATYESIVLLKLNDHWSSQVGLTMAYEQVKENQNIQSHINYLVPSLKLDYYSVTNPFSAQNGWRWQQEYRLGNQALSNPGFNFFQIEQKLKKIWQLSDDWRAIVRAQVAYTLMDDEDFIRLMPTSYRYFAGGDISVRGYAFQSLAPADSLGQLVGGKHLVTATLEFDWRFADDFRWAVFYDQGNAFNDWREMQLNTSVGTGIRWVTPFGSFRIDYAHSLDDPNDWRWHITIGPDL